MFLARTLTRSAERVSERQRTGLPFPPTADRVRCSDTLPWTSLLLCSRLQLNLDVIEEDAGPG